ncbi:MAG: hypothetical protein GVY24_06410 [Planctomycetes bacterium]|jgi:heme/copper-type cytochrome/quinol oxidase subunit 3|nr:hypothetical protein [Planctomycetota bacterium]
MNDADRQHEPPHEPTRAGRDAYRPPLPTARRLGTFGIVLFLISLSMLFLFSLIGYVVYRLHLADAGSVKHLPLGELDLPLYLWLSTLIIVVSSAILHYAGISVAHERQGAFRKAIAATAALAVLFLIVQVPALADLYTSVELAGGEGSPLPRLVMMLIILHAIHVVGGIVPLGVIAAKARRGAYDHEHHHPITHFALYWHFLGVVWIVMFSVELLQ